MYFSAISLKLYPVWPITPHHNAFRTEFGRMKHCDDLIRHLLVELNKYSTGANKLPEVIL